MRPLNCPHTIRTCLFVLALTLSGHVPLLAASGPPLRTGLWMTQPIEGGDKAAGFEAQVRANPHLSGMCLHIGWKDIERSEEHTSELQSLRHLVCRLLL